MRSTLTAVALLIVALAYGGSIAAQVAPAPASAPAASAAAPVGDAAAGKAAYAFGNTSCSNCHGRDGEGSFAPALAGRKLTYKRFHDYVRSPLGRMPAYIESELTDQEIADMVAYFETLPPPAKPSALRTPLPAGAPRGQTLALSTVGCGQCHGATFETPRHGAAEVAGDFEWFKHMVYEHTTAQREQWSQLDPSLRPVTPQPAGPNNRNRIRMGNYSRTRLPEATLKEIWDWVNELGPHLPPLTGTLSAPTSGASGVTYTLNVANAGVKNKGVTVEEVTVALEVPAQGSVVSATGTGYQGVRADPEGKGTVAVWVLPRLAATDRQSLTITFAGPIAGADAPKGTIRWAKPSVKADDVVDITSARGRGRG